MDEDRRFALESRLTNTGCYLTGVAETEDGYDVTYQSVAADQHGEVPHQQVGDVVNVFRELADEEGWPRRTVHATVTDLDDDVLGTWRADEAWLDALAAGDLTDVEFSERVLATLDDE